MALFNPRGRSGSGPRPSLRVATPDGKCPLCKVGDPSGKVMIGPVEIAACQRCSGLLISGLNMARGMAKLAGWLRASREW